ncbi:MAG: HAD-IA family hydrolase [archaeon]
MIGLKLAVFDMAGTTVNDRVHGVPIVLKSYDDAFRCFGIEVPMEVLNLQRGRDKLTVIKEFGGDQAPEIYEEFVSTLKENCNKVREVEGVSETLNYLQEHRVRIVSSTGFPVEIAEPMVRHLGWLEQGLIDDWVCSEQVGISRPDPAMILYAMKKYEISNPGNVLKVDDTMKGIEEGLNAGVYTIGVLTGTQSREQLHSVNPDAVLDSVADIPGFMSSRNVF